MVIAGSGRLNMTVVIGGGMGGRESRFTKCKVTLGKTID